MRKLSDKAIAAGFTVEKYVTHEAYPKNGNLHNPTKYYAWRIRLNGEYMGRDFTLRKALEFAETLNKELEETGEIK